MADKIEVFNKSAGIVMYKIPGSPTGNVRTFTPHQKQTVPVQELIDLGQQSGGPQLLYHFLYINDPEILQTALNIKPEPEYWLTEDKIPGWMNSSSLDEFIDALNFAPEGTKDIIKSIAVQQQLNDYSKREAIKEILGYDVTAAIEAAKPDEGEAIPQSTTPTRRVKPKVTRRIATSE